MAINHTSSKFTISLVEKDLFEKICNISALNVKYVSPDINADSLILSGDEKYFFDTNLPDILSTLAGYFVRVMGKDDTYKVDSGNITLTFTSEKQSSAGEENILSTLVEQYIIVEVLRLWYISVAVNEVLAAKYTAESSSIDRRLRIALFTFYRPAHSSSVFGYIKVVGAPGAEKIQHINNRSDFVLLWKAKDGEELPNKFTISFYTTGAELYEVEYDSAAQESEYPKVVPIADADGKCRSAHIVFDLSPTASYFTDGQLAYTMISYIENPMFSGGEQVVESSATLPVEIWGGPSDEVGKIAANYIPAFVKLHLSDLTSAEIEMLQAPALQAAQEATTQAEYATTQAEYAKEQGEYANERAKYAHRKGNDAEFAALSAQQAMENCQATNAAVKEAEAQRVLAEQEREEAWGNLSSVVNAAITTTYQSSSKADKAALSASTAATNANNAIEEMQQSFDNKVAEVDTQVSEKIAAADAATERANTAADNADAAREAIQEDLGRKANTDGIYPKMSVGFSENIVGDGSATEEEFSFRPTAGVNRNTLNDGAARIHTLKGNSIVANQLFNITKDGELKNGLSYTRVGDNTIILNGTATTFTVFFFGTGVDIIANHSYFLGAIDGAENTQDWYFTNQMTINSYGGMAVINTPVSSFNTSILLRVNEGVTFDNKRITINFIDLTLMFGAGNEPLTVEEYYQRKPIGINEDECNEGKLVNLVPKAIKTTGLNQFNGTYAKVLGGVQYYLGGNYTSVGFATEEGGVIEAITTPTSSEVAGGSAPADRLYTPSQNGYIYANGDSICISLYWPTEYGNLYGTYHPYKPFERDLSWIKTIKDSTGNALFPNGMRSAGSAHDEIRFNSTTQQWEAVQRVDVRPYAAGDESDSAVTTDGTNTNYTLATPTITPIVENINFDYDVSDYGTEELIVAEGVESAPLSASIEYSPNVLAMLKNAPDIADDVDMLKSQLAALTAQLAALTATNNE